MARPRNFDTDTAIIKAMDVFWDHGYENATLPDLLKGMGLTRGSLYKAFKDKKSLFLIVLDRYDQGAVAEAVTLLTDNNIPDGWDRIMTLFDSISEAVGNDDRRGCLLCSAAAGPASYDKEIGAAVNEALEQMRVAFQIALGESGGLDLANLLVTQYVGLRVLSRSQVPASVVAKSVEELRQLQNYSSDDRSSL